MIKLIAIDMDGTLLNSDLCILESTKIAIEKCTNLGIMTVISTGRPIQGVKRYLDELKLNTPSITYNGAVIVDNINDEVLCEMKLERENAKTILEIGEKLGVTAVVWSNQKLYFNKVNENATKYRELAYIDAEVIKDSKIILDQGITKIIWIGDKEKIAEYKVVLKEELKDNVNYCTSNPKYLEFFNKKASKGKALEFLCEKYGIKPEQIMAIGDGENDLTMVKYAGTSVAMGNAIDILKNQVDFITETNNKDGVAMAINKFVLDK